MTYIPGGGGTGSSSPVAFDANDLFCWQTTEDAAATSWPNQVPGGATATLTKGADSTTRGGAPNIIRTAGEFSYTCSNLYPAATPTGASANVGPNNDFTIDWYMMPHGPAQTGGSYGTGSWVWTKLREANTNSLANASVGMSMKYATAGSPRSQFMDWEIVCRLTSGNTITMSPGALDYPAQLMLIPHVLYHVGITLSLSGGNTIMRIYWNGSKIDTVSVSAVGTAVEWNTGFPWGLGLAHNGTFNFNSWSGRIQRLRVSNIVRPDAYFLNAYNAIR